MIEGGPWVRMAVLCERIETGPDTQDVVGLMNRLMIDPLEIDRMRRGEPLSYELRLVVDLVAGEAHGPGVVSVRVVRPDGARAPGPSAELSFESEHEGCLVQIPIRFQVQMPGTYWFEISYDGRLVTRVPLVILVPGLKVVGQP